MITRKISYKIAVVLLAMCQLIQVLSITVYAEDLDDSGNAYETSDAITDAVASEDSFPNDGEVDVSLISSGDVGKVTYYAAIDDDWVEVATGNTVEGKAVLSGKSRYYVTADMLQSVYGAFGFDASNYNGERIFPHTDTYDPNHIWADAAPDGVGGEAKIPVSNREESYLFYLKSHMMCLYGQTLVVRTFLPINLFLM